jgi:hypothetical protein
MEFKDLIGKTIIAATPKKLLEYDDEGYLHLQFSDGTEAFIIAEYGGFTGDSFDEYPTYLSIADKCNRDLVNLSD